jgi:hypothetical protein
MRTDQPSQTPEKTDADSIVQMEEDLHALHGHIANLEDRLCCIVIRLQTAQLDTPETVLTHPGGPA